MVYRRGAAEMGATDFEQHVAQSNGVLIKTWAQPTRILVDDGWLSAMEFEYTHNNQQGSLEGTGERFTIPADQLFKAIGQHYLPYPFDGSDAPETERGRICVDAERRTSLSDVWAGGDCIAGLDLTVAAVQDGKIAAHSIHETLEGQD